MDIPYWLILAALVGAMAVRHARSPVPTDPSKRAVGLLAAGACLSATAWPGAVLPASLLLTGVGVYVYLHWELTTPGR